MKLYRGFPERLHHAVPEWVEDGALFHIRIALDRQVHQRPLIDSTLAPTILKSAETYQTKGCWHITLFVLMPDHLHALLSFPRDGSMSVVIKNWKRFHARTQNIVWQEGYFDHRLREDERGEQLPLKMNYIRQNPVAASYAKRPAAGRGKLIPSLRLPSPSEIAAPDGDATLFLAPKAVCFYQRVRDNAFHHRKKASV